MMKLHTARVNKAFETARCCGQKKAFEGKSACTEEEAGAALTQILDDLNYVKTQIEWSFEMSDHPK